MTPEQFKEERKALGLTQKQLAEAFDATGNWIGMMERGERPIEKRTVLALLGLSYLLRAARK